MLIRRSLLILLLASCATARPQGPPPTGLPAVELVTLEGQPIRLPQALEGKVALVAVWATWCEACATEFEPLARLAERAGARGAVVMAVAVGEKRTTVAEFVARKGLRYPQLVDEEFRLADALGQSRVPATLVIDRNGRIIFSGGVLDEGAIAALKGALERDVALR
ncbi:MAG TPA: TlpA disulfide reductase family protein [Polyangia bacterium]|nr:TlpA disulfide reductase family protein [Polyangia bacterium]